MADAVIAVIRTDQDVGSAEAPGEEASGCRGRNADQPRPDSKGDKAVTSSSHRLLVLDSSYALEAIRARGLEDSVTCRDLDGFFEHVWTVHPFATLVTSPGWTSRYGPPETHELASRHTFIEGKVGRFAFLSFLAPLNFIVGQMGVFLRLARLIRREKITAIRVGDPLYLGLLGWALARVTGIPLVVRIGANYDKIFETTRQPLQPRLFFTRRMEKVVERFIFARADLVAAANEDNLRFALANGAKAERSTVFRYGNLIDRRHFTDPAARGDATALLQEIGVQPRRFLICIGRLEKLKHSDDVVRVLAEVRKRGHEVKGVLVGDGSMRDELMELAHELGAGDHLICCGNRDQGWLAKVIPLAAVVVSPITGRALTEAAFGAAPIAAYDVDWQRELIRTGDTGELVPHKDWMKLADAVERFLHDPIYARAMSLAVRKEVFRMLDPERLNHHEREQYAALFRRGQPRS